MSLKLEGPQALPVRQRPALRELSWVRSMSAENRIVVGSLQPQLGEESTNSELKNWYDERHINNIDKKKASRSTKELARQEAQLVLDGERFVNQALKLLFPHRTVESIKGQRRNTRHKERVLRIIEELTVEYFKQLTHHQAAMRKLRTETQLLLSKTYFKILVLLRPRSFVQQVCLASANMLAYGRKTEFRKNWRFTC